MTKIDTKAWYKSKTKWAGILTGLGVIIPGLVQWLGGGVFPIAQVWTGVVAILGILGIRDLPVLNK